MSFGNIKAVFIVFAQSGCDFPTVQNISYQICCPNWEFQADTLSKTCSAMHI